MSTNLESDIHHFKVKLKKEGTYITHENTKRVFFRTDVGGWFWLSDPGFPFDEDVRLIGRTAEYLESLLETAQAGSVIK